MSRYQKFRVVDPEGSPGTLFATSRFLDDSRHKLLRLESGEEVLVPSELLRPQNDGSYLLTVPIHKIVKGSEPPSVREPAPSRSETASVAASDPVGRRSTTSTETVVPVVEEELDITRRQVEDGRVRIHKRVENQDTVIDEPLTHYGYEIERSAVNRIIDQPVEARYEGDTLVLPVLEEVLVVEKRLVLKEEVRITPRRQDMRDRQTHTVRREHVEVERVPQS